MESNLVLMKKSNNRQVWITTGHNLFSEEGHEGIQIERLARITGLNKSGFYHYFGDIHEFLKVLIRDQDRIIDELLPSISRIESYDPGFFELMLQNKNVCFFHIQLVRNRHIKYFFEAHERTNLKIDPLVIPAFSKEIGLSEKSAVPYYEMMRDMFYTRVDYKEFNHEFLRSMMEKFKRMIPVIMNDKSE